MAPGHHVHRRTNRLYARKVVHGIVSQSKTIFLGTWAKASEEHVDEKKGKKNQGKEKNACGIDEFEYITSKLFNPEKILLSSKMKAK
jgi:hypothetical protein